MNASEKLELKRRAHYVLHGSIPECVRLGDASAAADYRDMAAVVSTFVRRGTDAEKAKLAVLRLEGMRGAAGRGPACGDGHHSAARSATPPSNTGVSEGRKWLLGSGL